MPPAQPGQEVEAWFASVFCTPFQHNHKTEADRQACALRALAQIPATAEAPRA